MPNSFPPPSLNIGTTVVGWGCTHNQEEPNDSEEIPQRGLDADARGQVIPPTDQDQGAIPGGGIGTTPDNIGPCRVVLARPVGTTWGWGNHMGHRLVEAEHHRCRQCHHQAVDECHSSSEESRIIASSAKTSSTRHLFSFDSVSA